MAGEGAFESRNYGLECCDPGGGAEANGIEKMHQINAVQIKISKAEWAIRSIKQTAAQYLVAEIEYISLGL